MQGKDGAANIFDVYYPSSEKASKMRAFLLAFSLVEPQIRLELMTCRLQGGCSTNWAIAACNRCILYDFALFRNFADRFGGAGCDGRFAGDAVLM